MQAAEVGSTDNHPAVLTYLASLRTFQLDFNGIYLVDINAASCGVSRFDGRNH